LRKSKPLSFRSAADFAYFLKVGRDAGCSSAFIAPKAAELEKFKNIVLRFILVNLL
jgi:hypothetical protein